MKNHPSYLVEGLEYNIFENFAAAADLDLDILRHSLALDGHIDMMAELAT
jgi:hypothetical protein